MESSELMEELKDNIQKLKEMYLSEKEKNEVLSKEIEILNHHNNIFLQESIQLRERINHLRLGKMITGLSNNKEQSLKTIDGLIKQLNRSIDLL